MADKKQWESDGATLADSNCSEIGSDADKAVRKAAAETEPAWKDAGREPGVQVWRIENFKVVPWPKTEYGNFYSGDSYIVMQTLKADDGSLSHNIFFWLGKDSTADEKGTAAYKTVELDDLFDGMPTQTEVQGYESAHFKKLFAKITYLDGGVDSGFNHVGPDAYQSKLLQVRRLSSGTTVVREVPLCRDSLNNGDCFVLDAGATIYVWVGSQASPFEKNLANSHAENLESQRHGKATASHDINERFWSILGGEGPVKDHGEDEVTKAEPPEGILYSISDTQGDLHTTEVSRRELTKCMLNSSDVMMLDTGSEVFLWVGSGASSLESRNAFRTATNFLRVNSRPANIPIHMFKEGSKISDPTWNRVFAN